MFPSSLTRCRTLSGSCFFVWMLAAMPAAAQPPLPPVDLQVGSHAIRAEHATTPEALREGLMHRTALDPDGGMLFELGAPDVQCFWMKNTRIPLSIAFIDQHGLIVDIQDMQAQSLEPHCPPVPITQALEMNLGWFARNQVKTGDAVRR